MFPLHNIDLHTYEFKFNPFGYKLNISGRLEIKTDYNISAQMLVGKFNFPNQRIELVDIVPDFFDSCKNTSGKEKCRVFKFNTFLQLSGDSFFAREFHTKEKIPFFFNLDFNTANLEAFKQQNYRYEKKYDYKNNTRNFSNFLSELKLLQVKSEFDYQNSFVVERGKKYNSSYKLSIPKSWIIRNGIQVNQYEDIEFKLNTYDRLNNYYLKEWFKIKTNARVDLEGGHIDLQNGATFPIDKKYINKTESFNWKSYSFDGTIKKVNDTYVLQYDPENSGIFFPESISGSVNTYLRVFIDHHAYVIKVKNPFTFVTNFNSNYIQDFRAWVESKYDDRFKDLTKFKFFSL